MKTNDELQKDVMAEIKWDPQLRAVANEIGVSAKDGVVTLSGIVDTYSRKLAAEHAAQRVSGVKVVAVDIEVKVSSSVTKSDTEIATAIRNALMWNTNINEDKIEVKVDNGWVYLDGAVDWEFERRTAKSAIENLAGIRGITNNIIVKSKVIDDKDIKKKITTAFHRSATVDASSIRVEVSGSTVILRGTVTSWAEKEDAEKVAWASPGVFNVENNIVIDTEVYV
jgi:osmotically-inducible protein OsmY